MRPLTLHSKPISSPSKSISSPSKAVSSPYKAVSKTKSGLDLSRDAATAFLEADVDGDRKVSFAEFMSRMVPSNMLASTSNEALRELFDSVDTDGSGFITMDEFFLWTLRFAQDHTGAGIEVVFRRYDKTGEGVLDANEFAQAAEELGFGAVAHEVFMELDPDGSGAVSHHEMLNTLKERSISQDAKRFLTGLAFDAGRKAVTLDVTTWTLKPENKQSVRAQLVSFLARHDPPARASDLYRAMTGGGEEVLKRDSFHLAMARIGMPPKHEALVEEIFTELDGDGSGAIGDSEMSTWIQGGEGRKTRARKLTLRASHPDAEGPRAQVKDPIKLRAELQLALIRSGLSPIDLLRAYDTSGEGSFSKREFLSMMKAIVSDQEAWEDGVRDVVLVLFRTVAGEDRTVDVAEFQSWLQKGWRALKQRESAAAKGNFCLGAMSGDFARRAAGSLSEGGYGLASPESPQNGTATPNQLVEPSADEPMRDVLANSHSMATMERQLGMASPLRQRAWVMRHGAAAYTRRWAYRPAPSRIDQRPVPSPKLPPWRPTVATKNGSHFLVREEAEGVRPLRRGEAAVPRRVVCFYQHHRPAPHGMAPVLHHRNPPPPPFAAISRTRMTVQEMVTLDEISAHQEFLGRTKNTT